MDRQSPFPGMDPFLEERSRWSGVHARLIVAISDQLAVKVAPAFYVDIEQRDYIVSPDDPYERQQIVPDVYLIKEQQTEYAHYDDVPLDLQAAFADIYQRARYGWQIDYTRPVPPPALRTADHNWVQQCLQSWQAETQGVS